MEKLQFKVCSRIRNFLIAKFNNLQKPQSNFQIYQENVLLKFKPLINFVRTNHLQTYVELTETYTDLMQALYYDRLK